MCQKCNEGCISCKCTCKKRCVSQNCTCPVIISTNCITSFTEELTCSNIPAGQTLNETLLALDAYICERFNSVSSFFDLVNVGNGLGVYKGTNNLGQKELKSLIQSGLISITSQVNTVTISVNESLLGEFIQDNQLTYSAQTIGAEGEAVYSNNSVVGNNTNFQFKTIKSDSLSITATDTEISIEQPMSASIPALYVNSAYIPTYDEFASGNTKGQGTLAKPYTNTVSYSSPISSPTILPNTAIQNALDAYVGTGSRLNPQLAGQQIVIQNSNSVYTFGGDFNYSSLNLRIEGNILSTSTGFLVNMDNPSNFNATSSNVLIEITTTGTLELSGTGFNNAGNTVPTETYITGRVLEIKGEGLLLSQTNNINYYLFNSDPEGTVNGTTGNNNGGLIAILIYVDIKARYQGIAKVGGKSKIDLYGNIESGTFPSTTINSALKVFNVTGGRLRLFNNEVVFYNGTRDTIFHAAPQNGFLPNITGRGVSLQGTSTVVFTKGSTGLVEFDWQDGKSIYLTVDTLFASPNLWNVVFNNNNIGANVDFSVVDFFQTFGASTFNLLGGYVTTSLIMATSKKNAVDSGVDKYALFINRNVVTAGNFIVGQEYKIASIGTTDYTSIGAASNTVGLFFTSTGSGSGSGQAYLDKLDIVT